jgi:hypothetical protein
MNKYIIHNIKPLHAIENGLYLVILHAKEVPPHIGLIYDQKYYSLTIKGKTLGDDVSVLQQLIKRKKIKTLFFKLTNCKDELSAITTAYLEKERVIGNITCLYPVKAALSKLYSDAIQSAKFVYEVLPELYKNENIEAVYHANMGGDIKQGDFPFSKYSMKDIITRIQSYEIEEVC